MIEREVRPAALRKTGNRKRYRVWFSESDRKIDSIGCHWRLFFRIRNPFGQLALTKFVSIDAGLHVKKMKEEYPPSGKVGQAVKYCLSREASLRAWLEDGKILIDNNKAERMVKPFVVARKGFLFSDSRRGAEATAAGFSVLQSAVDNGLNPEKYLEWVQEKLSTEGLKDSVLDEVAPYSEDIPADLYIRKK
ncbi:transposase [uncultured Faecalibaculum sp.]|uniref:IS66 family transposase n=2 Tax=uncultured Faecalibaculum sp. TaxID=1729681 RepID=UPI00272EC1DB|nr:transposase [uncultured Faecalibaculum sp.]